MTSHPGIRNYFGLSWAIPFCCHPFINDSGDKLARTQIQMQMILN